MGWSGGTTVLLGLVQACNDIQIAPFKRFRLYKRMIKVLEGEDWDTHDECLCEDAALDDAIRAVHPEWFEDE